MFDSYKSFTRMGRRGQAKPGDMRRVENYKKEYVTIRFDNIKQETNRATLFVIRGETHWLPKSETTIYILNNTVEMPKWMAISRGLLN